MGRRIAAGLGNFEYGVIRRSQQPLRFIDADAIQVGEDRLPRLMPEYSGEMLGTEPDSPCQIGECQ